MSHFAEKDELAKSFLNISFPTLSLGRSARLGVRRPPSSPKGYHSCEHRQVAAGLWKNNTHYLKGWGILLGGRLRLQRMDGTHVGSTKAEKGSAENRKKRKDGLWV